MLLYPSIPLGLTQVPRQKDTDNSIEYVSTSAGHRAPAAGRGANKTKRLLVRAYFPGELEFQGNDNEQRQQQATSICFCGNVFARLHSAELGHLRQERQEPAGVLLHVSTLTEFSQHGYRSLDPSRAAFASPETAERKAKAIV